MRESRELFIKRVWSLPFLKMIYFWNYISETDLTTPRGAIEYKIDMFLTCDGISILAPYDAERVQYERNMQSWHSISIGVSDVRTTCPHPHKWWIPSYREDAPVVVTDIGFLLGKI